MGLTHVSADEVQQQVQRILASPAFSRSRRLSQFLQFTVELTVNGRADEIKEHLIGAEVFERGPAFDSQTDTIVRTQAHRLRAALAAYYENEGRQDPLLIEFAKGSYVPLIRENEQSRPMQAEARAGAPGLYRRALPAALAAIAVFAAGVFSAPWFPTAPAPGLPLAHITLPLYAQGVLNLGLGSTAISPNGAAVVFPLIEDSGARRLWMRRLRSLSAVGLAGTQDGYHPFWSPDGSEIGFFANEKLKVLRISDGNVRDLCDAPLGRGGSWSREGVIIFTPEAASGCVYRIAASGGAPTRLTRLDAARDEGSHRWPAFLGDGDHFVYASQSRKSGLDGIFLSSLSGEAPTLLEPTLSQARYVRLGDAEYLLYVKENTVRARRLNVAQKRLEGAEIMLVKGVYYAPGSGASFSVAGDRYLVYQSARSQDATPVLLDRGGRVVRNLGTRGNYEALALSHDGRSLAAEIAPNELSETDIWVGGADKLAFLRVTVGGGAQVAWHPNGRAIVFVSPADGFTSLRTQSLAEGEKQSVIWRTSNSTFPTDISPDGRYLAFHINNPTTQMDLWLLPLDPATGRAAGEPMVVRRTRFNETMGFFSPDGRYLAYGSEESGSQEIYVEALPPGRIGQGRRWRISSGGGMHPRWRRDGKELLYLSTDRSLMSVSVAQSADGLSFSSPKRLFTPQATTASGRRSPYAISRDGATFYFLVSPAGSGAHQVSMVAGWTALLNPHLQ